MYSRLLRTFVAIAIIFLAHLTAFGEIVRIHVGHGSDPKWSPSGKLISVVADGAIDIFRADSIIKITSLKVDRLWLYHWLNDDTLALYIKEYTSAVRPIDSYRVGINCILPLTGELIEIARDTAFSPRDYMTPWQRLPDGSVGIFKVVQDVRTEFLRLAGSSLRPESADTSRIVECRDYFARLVPGAEVTPSSDCGLALIVRGEDQALYVIDSLGIERSNLGPRVHDLGKMHFRYLGFPSWSVDSRYLTLQEEIEDGHTTFSNDILLVDAQSGAVIKITNTKECGASGVQWAPTESAFVYREGCTGTIFMIKLQK